MFTLTRREKNVVLYVLISVVIGFGLRRCREHQPEKASAPEIPEARAAVTNRDKPLD